MIDYTDILTRFMHSSPVGEVPYAYQPWCYGASIGLLEDEFCIVVDIRFSDRAKMPDNFPTKFEELPVIIRIAK